MTYSEQESSLWLETPLILSSHLSALLDCNVYLKLENLQPSHSFKYRGISLFAQYCKATRGDGVHLIMASGGNAGLAAACAANRLGLRCTVYLPGGTSKYMIDRLTKEKAGVVVVGEYYFQAAQEAQQAVKLDPNACYVHGYEGDILWKGHGSMITEISHQLPEKPDAIFCSVGGGGLLGGIIDGCRNTSWDDGKVPIVAVETHGAAAFYHSVSVNDNRWNTTSPLPPGAIIMTDEQHNVKIVNIHITSRASSLAATTPSAPVVSAVLERKGGIICATIPDEMAMSATCLFADDHKILAELACSATLALAYHPDLFQRIQQAHIAKGDNNSQKGQTVVFIVCGGVKISVDEVHEYETVIQDAMRKGSRAWEVFCNGERWDINVRR